MADKNFSKPTIVIHLQVVDVRDTLNGPKGPFIVQLGISFITLDEQTKPRYQLPRDKILTTKFDQDMLVSTSLDDLQRQIRGQQRGGRGRGIRGRGARGGVVQQRGRGRSTDIAQQILSRGSGLRGGRGGNQATGSVPNMIDDGKTKIRLKIQNLPPNMTLETLQTYFGKYGNLKNANLNPHPENAQKVHGCVQWEGTIMVGELKKMVNSQVMIEDRVLSLTLDLVGQSGQPTVNLAKTGEAPTGKRTAQQPLLASPMQ
eukprot:gene4313-2294_t